MVERGSVFFLLEIWIWIRVFMFLEGLIRIHIVGARYGFISNPSMADMDLVRGKSQNLIVHVIEMFKNLFFVLVRGWIRIHGGRAYTPSLLPGGVLPAPTVPVRNLPSCRPNL